MAKGVLLVNLGSPESTKTSDVRRYLREFLMDERVLDSPYLVRKFVVEALILPTRPKKSAAAYQKIWTKDGSPLVVISQKLRQKVEVKLNKPTIPIVLAMRYGSMSIENGLVELVQKGVDEIFLIPLYPHYAMSSTETVIAKAQEVIAKKFSTVKLSTLERFYNHPDYIKALGESIKHNLPSDYDLLLFSYHGLPERHILKKDNFNHCKLDGVCCYTPSEAHKTCYRHQCYTTTKLVSEYLDIPSEKTFVSFQSRLGRDPWLKPYTDKVLETLPAEGKKKIAVVTPAFVSDCLETLEEIAMEGKKEFLAHGGSQFTYLPCMNLSDLWVEALIRWINEYINK